MPDKSTTTPTPLKLPESALHDNEPHVIYPQGCDCDGYWDAEFEQIANDIYLDEQLIGCMKEMHQKGLTDAWMSHSDIQQKIPTAEMVLFAKLPLFAAFGVTSGQSRLILERQQQSTSELFRLTVTKHSPATDLANNSWGYLYTLPESLNPTTKELANVHLSQADYQELLAQLAAAPLIDANQRPIVKPEGNLKCERIITYLNSHPPRPTNKPVFSSQYINCYNAGNDLSLMVEMDQAGLTGKELTLREITVLLNAYQEYVVPISRNEVAAIIESIFRRSRAKSADMRGYTLSRRKRKGEVLYQITRKYTLPLT